MKINIKTHSKLSFRFGVVASVFAALVATSLATVNAETTPILGQRCENEGSNTGISSTSLICVKDKAGNLVWARVKVNSSGGQPQPAIRVSGGSIEFHHWRGEDQAYFDKIISQFQAANPGTTVKQVILDSTSYANLAYSKISTNPKAAIFATMRGAQFKQFYDGGLLRDISSERFVTNNIVKSALTPGIVDGKIYGAPYHALFNNPLYNADMFAKKGWKVPTNFTQVLAFCKTAKAAGVIPFAWPAATRGNGGQIFNSFLMNSAPDIATLTKNIADLEAGTTDLTSAWFKGIATKYQQMGDAGCFPANVSGYNDTVAPSDFALGKAAIYPCGTFCMAAVTKVNPDMAGKMKMMGLILTDDKPIYEGITNNTFILSVNAKASTKDQQVARAFMSFLLQPSIAQYYGVASSQHTSVVNADYSANVDLLNTSDIMGKKLLLAPRFLFLLPQAKVRDVVEDALIAAATGSNLTTMLAEKSKIIKQNLGK